MYRVGGAQAIAALAYGTETIEPVDVIVGPGNVYVAIAKREVAQAGLVGVPSAFSGPSEVVVVVDGSATADFAAIDVIVQAEHGPDGLAWLVTLGAGGARRRRDRRGPARRRRPSPRATSRPPSPAGGHAVLVDSPEDAIAVSNAIAPEHLELMVRRSGARCVALVRHAGAVFTGAWSPASVGDYVAGPSHVLPTFGSARFGQALTVADFIKHVHVVHAGRDRPCARSAPTSSALAEEEGLPAHADSVRAAGRREEPGVTRPRVRDDLQALEGYHSPQVSVAVRLNTNESPEPPPPAWRDALAAELSRAGLAPVPGPRRARELREAIGALARRAAPPRSSRPTARTRCCRPCSWPMPVPAATVVTFEPTYQLHGHIARLTGALVAEGERRRRLHARRLARRAG